MMMKIPRTSLVIILSFLLIAEGNTQPYSEASVFAHNDYIQPVPFYTAYKAKAGYIEADIFLVDDELYVSHTHNEINQENTLESLYLKRFEQAIKEGMTHHTTLMIDLKTKGVPTVSKLISVLKKYPSLVTCDRLTVAISGDMPDVALWQNYPDLLYFDGRPHIQYQADQLKRVVMVSTSFQLLSKWKGEGPLPDEDRTKIINLRDQVHAQGKKLRLWGAPDSIECWKLYMELGIDIINTDHVSELVEFLRR